MSKSYASSAQIEANRANAQKSTGPKTDQGKLAAAQNAVKHGLFRSVLVLPNESQVEFDELIGGMNSSYEPQNLAERHFVEQMVEAMWKLRRAQRCERLLYLVDAAQAVKQRTYLASERKLPAEPPPFRAERVLGNLLDGEERGKRFQRMADLQNRLQATIARAQRELERCRRIRRAAEQTESKPAQVPAQLPASPPPAPPATLPTTLQNEAL